MCGILCCSSCSSFSEPSSNRNVFLPSALQAAGMPPYTAALSPAPASPMEMEMDREFKRAETPARTPIVLFGGSHRALLSSEELVAVLRESIKTPTAPLALHSESDASDTH